MDENTGRFAAATPARKCPRCQSPARKEWIRCQRCGFDLAKFEGEIAETLNSSGRKGVGGASGRGQKENGIARTSI